MINLYTEGEFERFSSQQVDLAENQVLFFDSLDTFPDDVDSLQFDGNTFEIAPLDYELPPDASSFAQVYEQYALVVKDTAVAVGILAPGGNDIPPTCLTT